MITNKEKGFRNWSGEPEVTSQPSVTSEDALLFKSFVDASESENVTKEFSGVSKNFCTKSSSVEKDAGSKPESAELPPCPHVFGTRISSEANQILENYKNQAYSLEKETFRLKGITNVMSDSLFKFLHFGGK